MEADLANVAVNTVGVARNISGVDCVSKRAYRSGMTDCGYTGGCR